jgi:predicted AlkP superfamily phosphohydrolase/phosphomutase
MTKTLVIGLDAFDPELARHWMRAGHLPNLAALAERGGWADTLPPLGLFVGTIWPVLTRSVCCTASRSGRTALRGRTGRSPRCVNGVRTITTWALKPFRQRLPIN